MNIYYAVRFVSLAYALSLVAGCTLPAELSQPAPGPGAEGNVSEQNLAPAVHSVADCHMTARPPDAGADWEPSYGACAPSAWEGFRLPL